MTAAILFAGGSDNADISNRVCKGLRECGVHARTLTIRKHPFGYEQDLIGDAGVRELLANERPFDWVIGVGDSNYKALEGLCKKLTPLVVNARRAVRHGGSAFRAAPNFHNKYDQRFAKRFLGSDLLRFAIGDSNSVPYFAPPHDIVESIAVAPTKLRIGHSPSKRAFKGTDAIMSVLNELDRSAVDVDLIEGVPFQECLERRKRCHIFIDQMSPLIGGFGASSVEGLAAGCVVFADIRHVSSEVNRFYPIPPIVDVRDVDELRVRLERVMRDRHLLASLRWSSLDWVRSNATPLMIGEYWLRHLSSTGLKG